MIYFLEITLFFLGNRKHYKLYEHVSFLDSYPNQNNFICKLKYDSLIKPVRTQREDIT